MRGALLRNALLRNFHFSRNRHFHRNLKPATVIRNGFTDSCCKNYTSGSGRLLNNFPPRVRFFSSENETPDPDSKPESESSESKPEEQNAAVAETVGDGVDIEELKRQITDCLKTGKGLKKVMQSLEKEFLGKDGAALKKLSDEISELVGSVRNESDDSETDTELLNSDSEDSEYSESDDEDGRLEELCFRLKMDKKQVVPLLKREGFDHLLEKEEKEEEEENDIGPLCDADNVVMKEMASDPLFNMNDKKWDEMMNEAMAQGMLPNIKECEFILEDMLNPDKPIPDIKSVVVEKFNEISDRIEKGELSVEEGYELFKKFEDEIVMDCSKQMEAEGTTDSGKDAVNDPSEDGPTLRWQTRVVFLPGGDSWHPKNRKVKLATTVKEYGLTKPQYLRLRALVGKRYNPAKDELTITSERFEHREENRKDCLRTLLALMEEARKAEDLVHEVRVSDIKARLKANPKFMARLQSKKQATESKLVSA